MDINNKLILENTVKKNNINLKKLDSSIKSYDYFTRNFFLNNTIVPSVHVGADSRDSRHLRDLRDSHDLRDLRDSREENMAEQKQQFGISTRVARRN
jgi:hypothetical protein